MIENKVSKKYVLLLFSFLVLLVVGNLIVNFNLIDLTYLCFMIVMGLRYIKIKYTTQKVDLGQYIFYYIGVKFCINYYFIIYKRL